MSVGGFELSNYHSTRAWFEHITSHQSKTHRAAYAIMCAGEQGLTATELSKAWHEPEHRSCASALSRAIKSYPDHIVYRKQKGESHGRYYWRRVAPLQEEE